MTYKVAREPCVKDNSIYVFFNDFNMMKFMKGVFSSFSFMIFHDQNYDEIYDFWTAWAKTNHEKNRK